MHYGRCETNRFALLATNNDDDDDDEDDDDETKTLSHKKLLLRCDGDELVEGVVTVAATAVKPVTIYEDFYKDQTYYLIMGNEDVSSNNNAAASSSPPVPSSRAACEPTTSNVTGEPPSTSTMHNLNHSVSFFGKCFSCHYMSHSQKYCPLRLCKTCIRYGHAESVCQTSKAINSK
jgi:hypothetical protein